MDNGFSVLLWRLWNLHKMTKVVKVGVIECILKIVAIFIRNYFRLIILTFNITLTFANRIRRKDQNKTSKNIKD